MSDLPVPPVSDSPVAAAITTASRQYGVISWEQARAHGLHPWDLRRLRRHGTWGRPYPRVYSVRDLLPAPDDEDRLRTMVMAAQLNLGERAFAGGTTAARLWGMQGLEPWDGQEVHMVIPASGSPGHLHGVALHSWATATEEVATIDNGIRVTTPSRTLRDTLLRVPRKRAVCLIDSALNQGFIEQEDIEHLQAANRNRKGSVRVRRRWPLADGRAESPLETRVRLVCVDGGLPPSALQHRFTDRSGNLLAVVDFWWEELKLIGEADGLGPHSSPQALARDRERQNALQLWHPGTRIVRFTWEDLKRPAYILASVASAGRCSRSEFG